MADEVSPPRPLTPATFHILVTLAREPSHGYQIKRMVEDRTAGAVRLGAGTLYSGIRRMEKDGLIEETQPPAERGTEALEREIERLEADLAAARAVTPRPA